ncbi:MAG TPA: hypothetical protein PKE49_08345 [Leptospiraceae bacterium]|nr:hypothetical protein [Leptospiraceae bacterium]HMX56519.1 hypothetical protein [Leptospiraceae bacterium]HMY45835.1 hypothetical protein [Leptospiraceae bacterium]HMZ36019.1 hypothetical protein [Leptospiraceae bacterium]HNE24422.1 hypothetical protein [Leptospiraceae bacterium]
MIPKLRLTLSFAVGLLFGLLLYFLLFQSTSEIHHFLYEAF